MARHPSAPRGACLLAVLAILVVTAPAAFSSVYHVAPSGSDTNAGSSWVDAKKTIQAGIDAAAPSHSTVFVAKGTYAERIVVPAQVTLAGGYAGPGAANPDQQDVFANPTIIDGGNGGSVVTLSDGDFFRGFTVQHGTGTAGADGKDGGGIYAPNVANVAVRDCRITDCTADYGGGVYILNSPVTDAIMGVPNILSGNTFSNNRAVFDGGAIYSNTGSVLVSHNLIVSGHGRNGAGLCLNGPGINTQVHDNLVRSNDATLGGGIYVSGGQVKIYNNTVQGNTDAYIPYIPYDGGGGIYLSDGTIATVANNIMTGNTAGLRSYGPGVVAKRNDAWANSLYDYTDSTIDRSMNLSIDPFYTNPGAGDFTLQPISSCRDNGTDEFYDGIVPDLRTDLAGQPRLMGFHVDMGAYESAAPTTVRAVVPGKANPWLAGMPSGATAKGDTAPDASPTQVPAVLTPGTGIGFLADGFVSYDGGAHTGPPDGDPGEFYTNSADNGIAGVTAVANCLLGVFLDESRPDSTPAPAALSFGDAAALDFTILQPALKQVFFIGNGRMSTGVQQSVIVPAGATRLYLGILDGVQWTNNTGQFDVAVTLQGPPTPFSMTDARRALRMAGGFESPYTIDLINYNFVPGSAYAQKIDLPVAVRLARKVAGLEVNP